MHPLLLPVLPAGRLLLYLRLIMSLLLTLVMKMSYYRGVMVHGSVVDVEFHRVEPSSPWRVLLLLACIFAKSASDKTPFSGHSSHAMIKIYLTIKRLVKLRETQGGIHSIPHTTFPCGKNYEPIA
ncbi:hypothetical protein FB45DRAFT_869138 [Roridomyces roridus]|uniref:Uncharacterized protein n=1 Tax=Roridomyces roridus TaxID=1738132 RepID=A0AAD7FL47_9AGAR|nr:hypothetical protein FB45DRAFT_869138 [Roridomyces roridus]